MVLGTLLTLFQRGEGRPLGSGAAHVVVADHAHVIAGIRPQARDVEAPPSAKVADLPGTCGARGGHRLVGLWTGGAGVHLTAVGSGHKQGNEAGGHDLARKHNRNTV